MTLELQTREKVLGIHGTRQGDGLVPSSRPRSTADGHLVGIERFKGLRFDALVSGSGAILILGTEPSSQNDFLRARFP